jgi:hypothetical protein
MSAATLPRTRNKDQILAWANRQKYAPLSAAQVTALDSIYPGWRATHNGNWYTRLEAVEAFFAAHGRFPRAKAEDADEKSVGIWLATQRQRVGNMSPERRQVIDERLPGWCLTLAGQTRDTRWEASLRALIQFHAEEGRLPIQKAVNPAEAKLAAWLATQRKNIASISGQRSKALDDGLPSWRQSRDDIWTEQLRNTAAYLREHGFFPKSSSDSSVRRMANWMSFQRNTAGSMSSERLSALDEHIPGWRNRTAALWQRKLDQVAARLAASGHLPRQTSGDEDEARLAFWLAYQRKHRGKLNAEQIKVLDARAPGWDGVA